MIKKYMRGRLGNQLFQYATIRYIQEINGNKDKICLNFSKYIYSKNFENELKYFNVVNYDEISKIKVMPFQLFLIMYYKILKKFIYIFDKKNYYDKRYKLEDKISKKLIKNGIYWKEDGALNIIPTNCKNKIVIGHFESIKNFDSIKEKLQNEFTPKLPPINKNKKLYEIIKENNSVCISIRRGDFVNDEKISKKFNVCGIEYFKNAVKEIQKKVKNPVFIIFSDDINWCRKNIKIDGKMYFEDGNDPVWEKLRLMYSCKHFIISNSTFSFWAQYLSRNDKKIVVAPKIWRNGWYCKDIYSEDWILV